MNKKLSLFLIVSFMAVQVLSAVHMGEYGIGEHKHNGHVCAVYLHSEHTKYSTPSAAATVQPQEYFAFAITLPELLLVRSKSYGVASPRAPPLFS